MREEKSLLRQIPASEARAQWPKILDSVEKGETVVITRRGRAIARLVPELTAPPVNPEEKATNIQTLHEIVQEWEQFRRSGPRLTREEILAARHEGHKY